MLEEDQPPERIWLDPEALEAHFDEVRRKRKSKSSGTEKVPDLQQNELTKDLQ